MPARRSVRLPGSWTNGVQEVWNVPVSPTNPATMTAAVDRIVAGEEWTQVCADYLLAPDELSNAIIERLRMLSGKEALIVKVRAPRFRSVTGWIFGVRWRGELLVAESVTGGRRELDLHYRLDTRR